MKLKKVLAWVLCVAMVLSTMSFTVFADETSIDEGEASTNVAMVDGVEYETLEAALKAITSDSTVTLLSNIVIDGDENGNWDERHTGGKISMPVTIDGNYKTIEVKATVNDNNYDAFFRFEADATVKNLTMDFSGSTDTRIRAISAKAGNLVVENCTFIGKGSQDNSRAIIFGEGGRDSVADATVSISGCNFNGWRRGVTDNENGQDAKSVSVTGCAFTDASAYVSAHENVVFSGNTMDDGWVNIKTYSSSEELTILAENNTLEEENASENKIDGGAKAKIGNKYYLSLNKAIEDAQSGAVVEVLDDVEVDVWNSVANKNNLTINGNNKTITVTDSVYSNGNGGGLLRKASNLTINNLTVNLPAAPTGEMERLAIMYSGALNNVTVTGGSFALSILDGEGAVVINNCNFGNIAGWAIETEGIGNTALTVTNSTFDENAVILRGSNNTFTDNTITGAGEGVNVLGDAVISGNDFGASTLGIDRGVEVVVEKNIINNVEFSSWLPGDYSNVTVSSNTLSDEAVNVFNENLENDVVSVDPVATANGKNFYSLQEAIDAAVAGDNTITLLVANDKNVTISQKDGVNIVLDGANKNFSGTIFIHGNARHNGAETLTIKNVNFVADGEKDFISSNSTGSKERYAHNVTVEDCTFTSNTDEDVVGMRYRQVYNMTVKNCTFTNMHSAMWATGGERGITIDNATLINCKNGISVGTHTEVTVKNSKISTVGTAGYGIRADGSDDYSLVVENCEIDAFAPVLVRKSAPTYDANTGKQNNNPENYSLKVSNSTLNARNPKGYEIVVTGTDYDAPEKDITAPTEIKIDLDKDYVMSSYVAMTGGKGYTTLEAAADAASVGGVVDLLGNEFEITSVNTTKKMHTKNLTFQNGTMDFTNAVAGNSLFDMTANQSIKFKDMTLLIKDTEQGSKMCYWMDLRATTAVAYFENCVIDFDAVQYSYICANGDGKVFFKDCTIEAEQANFVYRAGATFENCTFDGYADLSEGESAGNIILWAAVPCTIKNSTVYTRQLGSITANGTIAIVENSYVYAERVRHYYSAGSSGYTPGLVTVDATSTLEAVELDMGMISENSEGVINSEASKVYVQFKKVDSEEGSDKYEIVLVGANNNAAAEKINELASADLTFNFVGTPVTGGAMAYTVEPANGVTLSQIGDRFMFNYNGVDKYEESGTAIVIGTIKIDGYGAYTLGIAVSDTNAVYATEIRDNIVDGFESAADLVINEDLFADDGMVGEITGGEIAVPVRDLAIKIDFPNAIENNEIAYQDMKVVISGGDLRENITVKLGTDAVETKLAISGKKDAKFASSMVDGSYVINVTDALTVNNSYTVTVSGAGYRTARYTVTMTTDKQLNFWNNVKDEAQVIEIGNDSVVTVKNFLAGDIVKDNKINIYDLSAVVSYFGSDATIENKYAKYDLNRDGVVDSKDVAYVLVSWDN